MISPVAGSGGKQSVGDFKASGGISPLTPMLVGFLMRFLISSIGSFIIPGTIGTPVAGFFFLLSPPGGRGESGTSGKLGSP